MPTKLRLSSKLSMPADAITRTFGIFGQRGTGKSTTGAVLVEQGIHVGGRAVVLDPTGSAARAASAPSYPEPGLVRAADLLFLEDAIA